MKVAKPLLRLRNKRKPPSLPSQDESPAATDNPPASHLPRVLPMRRRLREWIRTLQRDPSAEQIVSAERRERLLEELSRAVKDAPDDIPIRDLIGRINQHHDD